MATVFGLLRELDVLVLQEVHGTLRELRAELAPQERSYQVHMSIGQIGDAGGVAFVVKRKLLGEATEIRMHTLVDGRAAVLQVSAGDALLEVAGIHNYGLSVSQANFVASDLQGRTRAAQDAPMPR